ncbi:MAG: prolyl oligopeptidase family serine peptidase [Planctomycetota bacterium]
MTNKRSEAEEGDRRSDPVWQYPITQRSDVQDDYFGRRVADPYRWLEDVESDATASWVAAQNKLTRAHLDALPGRDEMRATLERLWNYPKTGLPRRRGETLFLSHNDGLQNQSVLYTAPADVDPDQLENARRLLIDPNQLSQDGTVALGSWVPSREGDLLAYSVADGGSDWRTWRVRDVESREDRSDLLRWSKFSSAAWRHDGSGFYYCRYAAPLEGEELTGTNENQMLCFHRLGTDQSADEIVLQRLEHPKWGYSPHVTDDGRYLVIGNWKGTEPKTQVFVQDLSRPDAPISGLIMGFDADFEFVGSRGSMFYFLTDHEAPRRRLIGMDVADYLETAGKRDPDVPIDRSEWVSVIEQTENVLESVSLFGETFYASYLADALGKVTRYDLSGTAVDELELPGVGSVFGFGGKHDAQETFFSFTNYVTPSSIYRVDLETGQASRWLAPDVAFDLEAFETRQVFCVSKDGTRVPLVITSRVGTPSDGRNPTLLYGYGGFNISLTPSFSPAIAAWIESGGVYVVANLRGGGEYGRDWHEGGMRLNKQNVFDDCFAAAEHLIAMQLTQPSCLGVRGGSNGGLLVGAVMTQRPDLFGACLPAVGVMDMLRYHKFTIGWAWATEYGSSDEEDQIDNLLSYSPLHNLRPGTCYPATLITTADRDDRVVPGHSFKFAAALQAAQSCDNPALIRIETRAGHGAGTPTSKRIDEYVDLWTFLHKHLSVE